VPDLECRNRLSDWVLEEGRRRGRLPLAGMPGFELQQRVGGARYARNASIRSSRSRPLVTAWTTLVPGSGPCAVDPCQRQPVQLVGGGPEPLRRGEQLGSLADFRCAPRLEESWWIRSGEKTSTS